MTIPWTESNSLLDIDYLYRWSGYKSISPLVAHLLDTDGTMSAAGYNTLAGIVWAHFGQPWTRAYNALVAEYNPLNNYDMTEHEDNEIIDDALTNVSGSSNSNKTTTNSTHNVYGYNSSSATPSESDSVSSGSDTDLDTNYDNTRTINRTLTRSGNIGVTTSQMMLESELQLRVYRFFERVYKDIDSVLVLPIYDGEISDAIYNGGGSAPHVAGVTSINGKTGDVTLYGSDVNLTNLISQSVADAIAGLNTGKQTKPVTLTGSFTGVDAMFTNDAIGDNSLIDIYIDRSDVRMVSWSQTGHTLYITLSEYTGTVNITLEVFN